MKSFLRIGGAIAVLGLALLIYSYTVALRAPVVRAAVLDMPRLPPGTRLRLVLISDIHVAGPDMPPARLASIVRQINDLQPDLVLIAGDLVSDKRVSTHRYEMVEAVAPLGGLRPRTGTFAVLGNHDHWRDTSQSLAALRRNGVTVLANNAVRAGRLAICGLDDPYTGRHDVPATLAALRRLGGAGILLSHSPDPFPNVPGGVPLMLAGHMHCGQIRLPFIGAVTYMSEHGDRYACGLVRENRKTLIVGAGVGTSVLPLRLGAVPDLWLITLRGPAR